MSSDPTEKDRDETRWALRSYAHLLAAWTAAVVQPTLVLLADNVELLAIRKSGAAELAFVIVAGTLLPPTVLLGLERIAALVSPRVRRGTHLLILGCLISLAGLYAFKAVSDSRGVLISASALIGLLAAFAYCRFREVRSFATVFLVILPLSLGAFFMNSGVRAFTGNPPVGPQVSDPKQVPVFLLMLDELPVSSLMSADGGLNRRRFPHFAALARDAFWFRNATAVAPFTDQAVPAVFTGMRPRAEAEPVRSEHPRSIFTVLANSHRVEAVEPYTQLCPDEICPRRRSAVRRMVSLSSALSIAYTHAISLDKLGIPLPSLGSTWGEAIGRKRPYREPSPSQAEQADLASYGGLAFEDFLSRIRPFRRGARPPLYVFHSSLPHTPWKYTPSGKRYTTSFAFPPVGGNDRPWPEDRNLTQLALQRHLLQVQFVDSLVGRLIDRLKASHLYDRSLVMVVADHGMSFRTGSTQRAITGPGAADTAFVPLFVKVPGQGGKVIDRHVETIDVLPTVADVLEAPLPYRVDGKSLLEEVSSGGTARLGSGQGPPQQHSLPFLKKSRAATIRRQAALFGEGVRVQARFPRDLAGAPPGVRAVIDSDVLLDVRPKSNFVPALVHGHIEGPSSHASRVAIEVNGTVAVVVPTYVRSGVQRFSAVIPEATLKPGRNRISASAVGKQH